MENPYMPELAIIKDIKMETDDVGTFTFSFQKERKFHPMPGQFVQISVFGYGEFPSSISAVLDADRGCFQTTIRRVGKVTEQLLKLNTNSIIGIRGPFGNGFPLSGMEGKDIYLVAGGTGITSINYLTQYLLGNKEKYGQLKLIYGAKKPKELIYRDSFLSINDKGRGPELDVALTVDEGEDGWKGNIGVVSELLDKTNINRQNAYMVICGPSGMMKSTIDKAIGAGVDDAHIVLSFERRMQCGLGICGHCMIGEKRVCLDGPVFTFNEVKDILDRLF